MKLLEFNGLHQDEKMQVLWFTGNYISDRYVNTYTIVLYQLFSFYVEVWYESDFNEIDILCAFDDTEELQPYLEKIDISSVINSIQSL